jgi:putative acetyltransferase
MPSILIRAYEDRDVPAITALYNQRSIALGTLQIIYTTNAERLSRWTTTDTQRMLVAEVDGEVAGHAGLTLYPRRRAHVATFGMAVDERFQGQGVGNALLAALIDLADNWYNVHRIELEVYCDNAPAIHLYEKHGFVIEGTHRAWAFRDGEYADVYTMARLRDTRNDAS